MALADVRKEIGFCKKVDIPILGVVENMSGFVCPKCKVSYHAFSPAQYADNVLIDRDQTETQIFAPTTGGAEKMCNDMGLTFLGKIPLDPSLARACDEGESYLERCPDSAGAKAYADIFSSFVSPPLAKKKKESWSNLPVYIF